MKDFMNFENVYETFLNLCNEVAEDYKDDFAKCELESICESYAENAAFETLESMKRYVHKKDTHMDGNFCNIKQDWNDMPDFIPSEITPWGKFEEIVKSIDDETISDEDLQKFQTWAFDWYTYAFGTYWFQYNFGSYLSERVYEKELESA